MKRLYLVVREDLSPGAQAVQALHAWREFAERYPDVERAWFAESNTLALLSVTDEASLVELASSAERAGIPHQLWREPDLGDATTALALGPDGRRLVRDLSLALSWRRFA